MLVRRKADGQLGELNPQEFDPGQYEQLQQPQASLDPQAGQQVTPQADPETQVRSSLAGDIGMNIAGSVLNPIIDFYNKAVSVTAGNEKKKGKIDAEGALKKTVDVATSPEAARAGAAAASYAVPFGKAGFVGSKFIVPGAYTGALQGMSEGDSLPEILGDATMGAASGGVLQGAGKVIGKTANAIKSVASSLSDKTGKSFALRGLKPTPSQQNNFYKETGEKLDDFIANRPNLVGADAEGIDNFITPLQQQFDDVVNLPGLTVDAATIGKRFSNEIERLNKSILPADKLKAQTLSTIRDNFMNQYGTKPLTGSVITALRRDVDAGIKDFALDPAVKSPLNVTRDIFQDTLREAADKAGITVQGKSLKQLGVELSKLYRVQSIADRQQFNGKSTNPIGLATLLGATAGGSAGIPGAIVGAVGTTIANSPKTSQIASKVLTNTSEGIDRLPEITLSGAKQNIAGQAGSRLPIITSNNGYNHAEQDNSQTSQTTLNNIHNGSSISEYDSVVNPEGALPAITTADYVTGKSPQEHMQAYMGALQAGDTKAATQIKGLYEAEIKYQETQSKTGTKKPLSVAAQTQVNLAKSGSRGLEEAISMYNEDPSLLAKQLIPGQWASRKFDSAMFKTVEALLRARSGAAVPEQEVRRYLTKYGATFGDSPDVVKFKFDQLRQDFQDVLEGANNTAGSTEYSSGSTLPEITL